MENSIASILCAKVYPFELIHALALMAIYTFIFWLQIAQKNNHNNAEVQQDIQKITSCTQLTTRQS